MPNSILEIKNYNNDFLILKSKNQSFLTEIGKSVFMQRLDFIDEVIVTPIEICLKLNENFEESKIEQLQKVEQKGIIKFKTYKLPVYFNEHEDWENVKSQTSFSKKEIIEKLITCNYSISMFGFLPGFIYKI